MKSTIIALSMILLFSISCTTSSEPEPKKFLNTVWSLTLIESQNDGAIIPPTNQIYQIQFFENNSLGGVNDCNTMFGTYERQSNNLLNITEFGGTKIYCGNSSMDDKFMAAILNAKSYKIDKDKLYIHYDSNSKLMFKAK